MQAMALALGNPHLLTTCRLTLSTRLYMANARRARWFGCKVQMYGTTPSLLAVYFQDFPEPNVFESNLPFDAGTVCGKGSSLIQTTMSPTLYRE
ncbi:hypothetical protein D9M68_279180 [compost metagenome]